MFFLHKENFTIFYVFKLKDVYSWEHGVFLDECLTDGLSRDEKGCQIGEASTKRSYYNSLLLPVTFIAKKKNKEESNI